MHEEEVIHKVKKLITLREDILTEAKTWKGKLCPLNTNVLSHYELSQLFDGLGSWGWQCPFCKEAFEE